jgi:hypothetical protein
MTASIRKRAQAKAKAQRKTGPHREPVDHKPERIALAEHLNKQPKLLNGTPLGVSNIAKAI